MDGWVKDFSHKINSLDGLIGFLCFRVRMNLNMIIHLSFINLAEKLGI